MADLYGVWVGIGRDEAQTLPAVLSSIATASGLFRGGCAVIIYENDSADGTAELVRAWGNSLEAKAGGVRRVVVLSEKLGVGVKRPSHSFLARCRNKYLDALETLVEEEPWLATAPDRVRVVAVDLDLRLGFPAPSVASSLRLLETLPGVGAVASNGVFTPQGHLYDAFAFRCADAFAVAPLAFDERAFGGLACFWAALNGDRERRPAFPPNLPPRPVDSAFGGLCCYRYAALEGLRHDDQCEDCEHVSLCRSMKRAGFEVLFNPAALLWNADYDDPRTLVGARVDAWAAYDDPAGPHLGAVHDDAATLDRDAWRRSGGGDAGGFEVVVQYFVAKTPRRRAEIDACAAQRGEPQRRAAPLPRRGRRRRGAPRDGRRPAVRPRRVSPGDGRRLTLGAAVAYADAVAAAGALVAVANADVALDHATCLRQAHRALCGRRHRVLALTRHETTPFGPQLFGGGARPDAQDCWLYLAPLELGRARKACDVPLGKGGADNRVAFQLLLGGVDVLNPARSVVVHHVQAEEKRGLARRRGEAALRVPAPGDDRGVPPRAVRAHGVPRRRPEPGPRDAPRGRLQVPRLRAAPRAPPRVAPPRPRQAPEREDARARGGAVARAERHGRARAPHAGDVALLPAAHADVAPPECAVKLHLRSLGDAGPDGPSTRRLRWATAATARPRDVANAARVRKPPEPRSSALVLEAEPDLATLAACRAAVLGYDRREVIPELLALGVVPVLAALSGDEEAKLAAAAIECGTHYVRADAYDPDDDAALAAIGRNGPAWYDAHAAPLATYKRAVALARLATGAPPAAGACLESE
ncbi:glycosyl transferase [Aureococcus anophagefferens]|nr:glycosyl transferase [Aureococcus anophagefferens]